MSEKFVRSLLQVYDEVGSKFESRPSFIRITTITAITSIVSGYKMDIEDFRTKFMSRASNFITGFEGGKKSHGVSWAKKDNAFYNQITVEYSDAYSKKSVKIFPNGTIHITGCYNPEDCSRVVENMQEILREIAGNEVICDTCKIVMINTNFSINSKLNLMYIMSSMKARGCVVSFNPETYSAVKIKFTPGPGMKTITASTFSSGKIIVTGAVNLDEIVASYKFILETILGEPRCLMDPVESRDEFNEFLGYDMNTVWRRKLNLGS